MTPDSSKDVNYLEPQDNYYHQSRSQARYQTDVDNKEPPHLDNCCRNGGKNGHPTSPCFKRQTNKYRQMNLESRQQYVAQPKSGKQ